MRIFPIFVKKTSGSSGQVPAVASTGQINTGMSVTFRLGAQPTGQMNATMSQTAALTVSQGTSGRSMTVSQLTGAPVISQGTSGRSMAVSQLTGAPTVSVGSRGDSCAASSSIVGRGYVTTAATTGGTIAWTSIASIEADDGVSAGWTKSDSVGGGTGATDNGTWTATNPKLGAIPAGFTRTKVEVLIHWNAASAGLAASGDTASFSVVLRNKTGAQLAIPLSISHTGNTTDASQTTTFDATTACAAVLDADLALMQFTAEAKFIRTLAATGTRSWTVGCDSVSVQVTYTRSGIT